MILNALEGKALPIYGDGRNVRDWLFVGDHCSAIQTVLDRGRVGETYNIGSNSERNNLEVVRAICAVLDDLVPDTVNGPRHKLIQFVPDRPGHDRRYAINASKIGAELGWQPTVRFEEGLRQTVAWYLNHSDWVESVRSGAYRDWIRQNYEERIAL
jgi:dTDP-glucose 4,6-dehydratase